MTQKKNLYILTVVLMQISSFQGLRILPKNEQKDTLVKQSSQSQEDEFIVQDITYYEEIDYEKQLKEILSSFRALRLGVFEAQQQLKSNFYENWEKREFGSTANAIKAFHDLINLDSFRQPLTIDFFERIRENFRDQQGNYTKDEQVNEVTDVEVFFGLPKLSTIQRRVLKNHQQNLKKRLNINEFPYFFISGMEFIQSNPVSIQEKKSWIIQLLDMYEEKINNQPQLSDQEFLETLALLIMDLERIHPYADYNCRTFAVFMLNKELLRRGMSPSIVENPNDFDLLDVEGAVEIIKDGQRNFQNLHQYGVYHISNQQVKRYIETRKGYVQEILIVYQDPDDISIIKSIGLYQNMNFFFCYNYDIKQIPLMAQYFKKSMIKSILKQVKNLNNSNTVEDIREAVIYVMSQNSVYDTIYKTLQSSDSHSQMLRQELDNHLLNYTKCENDSLEIRTVEQIKNRFNLMLKNKTQKKASILKI